MTQMRSALMLLGSCVLMGGSASGQMWLESASRTVSAEAGSVGSPPYYTYSNSTTAFGAWNPYYQNSNITQNRVDFTGEGDYFGGAGHYGDSSSYLTLNFHVVSSAQWELVRHANNGEYRFGPHLIRLADHVDLLAGIDHQYSDADLSGTLQPGEYTYWVELDGGDDLDVSETDTLTVVPAAPTCMAVLAIAGTSSRRSRR